jgi:hypothetical protein
MGASVGNVLQQGAGAYSLEIASPEWCLTVARRLAPFCFKKKAELMTVMDYYENRIDGKEALSRMNEAVVRGTRVGKIRALAVLPKIRRRKVQRRKRKRDEIRRSKKTKPRLAISFPSLRNVFWGKQILRGMGAF